MNVRLTAYEGGNSTKQVQNYRIANGTYTKDVEVFRNNKVEYTVADNSNSELKVFNLGDLADLLNS